ncbi:MAG: hypothetical protein DI533_00460 [Cereibacter sphaeroides]|uniref:Uncharacterized protein n=1 Tax=Cereibacter sphaeroides TaxID=1063 RepID=A0A2W5SHG5_CERSP|nr:MAG: hypothetical protein DI533_00460 [Cereibacter sphaeroides]
MNWLVDLLKSPSSFQSDPWGYVRNQMGHAYIVGGGLALLGVPLWLIFAGYLAWEATQYFAFRAELWDNFDDIAHVMLIAVAAQFRIPELLLCHALFVAAGFFCRRPAA